ncbi:MAG: hypothetical protein EBU70_05490 [Actinobacteria bacterium]|nr:hypothetical protein [Actinomycetota bacterium]
MAEIVLRFDAAARQWGCGTDGAVTWDLLDQATALLRVARAADGVAVGFILDLDRDDAEFPGSLSIVSALFGPAVADVVADEPARDEEVAVEVPGSADSGVVPAPDAEGEVMRPFPRASAGVPEAVVRDDPAAGTVTVTLTVPWWARFAHPWVTVRRRGRRDVLLTGPLRVKGRTATAVLRYGMPYPGSSLVADVVKGPRGSLVGRRLAWTLVVVALVVGAVGWSALDGSGGALSNPGPISWEVESGGFVFERIVFEQGKQCLGPGDRIEVIGRGFDGRSGEYGLYLSAWEDFLEPIPPDQLVPVPSAIESATVISAVVPPVEEFPRAPRAGEPVTVVLVADRNSPLAYGSTVADWCGGQ